MDQNLAIIDLGTNTFHLLIATNQNGTYTISHRERAPVKIGLGGINQDIIQKSGMDRAVAALKNFREVIDQKKVKRIYAFGTSALRNATNAEEIIQTIKEATGIDVIIISGEEEAVFIYQGIRSALDLGMETSLIMDIGGGSVEFIISNREKIYWKKSIEIGAQRLLEKFQRHDPIHESEIKDIDQYLDFLLKDFLEAIKTHKPTILVGSSGTFDTLSEIHCIRKSIQYEESAETPLTIKSFYAVYHELIQKNRAERLQIPGMIEMRVDMIVVACCLIRYVLEKHVFKGMRVSTYSLKEGVLASMTPPNPPHLGRIG